jgi:hypothetical protein
MAMGVTPTERGMTRLPFVACLLAVLASLIVLFVPLGSSESSCTVIAPAEGHATPSDTTPSCDQRVTRVSLVDEEGPGILIVVAIPVVIAGVALALYRTRWGRSAATAGGTLISLFSLLGAFSIGFFYLPSAIALFFASSHLPHPKRAT